MNIKRKIHLVMLLSLALGLALGALFFQAQRNIDAANAQERRANDIAMGLFQLTLLGQDVSLHPAESRACNQWQKQYLALEDVLRDVNFDEPLDREIVQRLRHAHEEQRKIFDALQLLTRKQSETGVTEITAEQLERLVYRLSFGAQSMLSDALSLERRKRMEITQYRRKVFGISLALAAILTSAIAVLAFLIGQSIIGPLTRLRRETEIIGTGNLAHRVGSAAKDELGDLSRDFNRMLDHLQEVTTSRDELRREIEARIRSEQALLKSERSLKKAQAIAHLGSCEWNLKSEQMVCSDEIYRVFGWQPGSFMPAYENFLDAVHPDDRPMVAQTIERARQGQGFSMEHRILLPNGDMRVVHDIGEVELDGTGTPLRIRGTVHDITERKCAEDKLHEANARLAAQLREIEKLQEELREQAIRDPLTGLFNRRYMEETLVREFAGAERENYPVSVIIMDIDHFKKINDTYGHQAGDMVLQTLGEQLRGHIRGRDIACRFGGEEFLAVLPHTPIITAAQRAELWRASFEALRITYEGREIRA
ncbi:MAG TPA: diguanylate cyclase, partial [Gallionella sp.]|nr:diguanylate cyclase [Gallionella sp.]